MEVIIEKIYQGVLNGDREIVIDSVQEAINAKIPADVILKESMMPAMAECGRLFEEGEYFVPELLIASRAMQGGMVLIKPLLITENVKSMGKIVIGTVKGDLHDIGKNLVGMMLEGAGLQVIDLGSDVDAEKFVEAVKTNDADLVGMSALLTTTMENMPVIINAIKEAGLKNHVKILVGGAPLTQAYADKIGADGYAPDASQAAKMAVNFLSEKKNNLT